MPLEAKRQNFERLPKNEQPEAGSAMFLRGMS
jgi:hypothetical protein